MTIDWQFMSQQTVQPNIPIKTEEVEVWDDQMLESFLNQV
jgi:hypothetical protein